MCGHNPIHLIRTSRNHLQDSPAPSLGSEFAPPATQITTRPCPKCSIHVQEDFVFCPRCGTELLSACPGCHRAVEASWSNCAYCGTDLAAE